LFAKGLVDKGEVDHDPDQQDGGEEQRYKTIMPHEDSANKGTYGKTDQGSQTQI
jgi:hypothetical protein